MSRFCVQSGSLVHLLLVLATRIGVTQSERPVIVSGVSSCGCSCPTVNPSPEGAHGIDVDQQGNGTVIEQRMYQLIRQPAPIVDRQFEIEFVGSGVEASSFTFG